MFRKLRKVTSLLILIAMFSSCSMPDENTITLTLPTYLPIVDVSKESPYMDLYVFDGEKVYHQFIKAGQTEITVPVIKGMMSLFTLTPYGRYSSVSSYYEPWMEEPSIFRPEHSQLIEFYTDAARHNPVLISDTCISELIKLYPETDSIDKMKLLEYLEKGDPEDPLIPDFTSPCFEVEVETYIPGMWHSDRADMQDFMISHTTEKLVLNLYEGVYHYFHEDGRHHLMVVVTEDGKTSSRLDYTVW